MRKACPKSSTKWNCSPSRMSELMFATSGSLLRGSTISLILYRLATRIFSLQSVTPSTRPDNDSCPDIATPDFTRLLRAALVR